MKIRMLKAEEQPPWDLLLLADPFLDKVEDYLRRGVCYVAEDNGRWVGASILFSLDEYTLELVNVAVLEEEQGKGIGKELVMHAIRKAQLEGYQMIVVGTGNSSIMQLGFYQKCGFRITEVWRDFFVEKYDEPIFEDGIETRDMIRLEREL